MQVRFQGIRDIQRNLLQAAVVQAYRETPTDLQQKTEELVQFQAQQLGGKMVSSNALHTRKQALALDHIHAGTIRGLVMAATLDPDYSLFKKGKNPERVMQEKVFSKETGKIVDVETTPEEQRFSIRDFLEGVAAKAFKAIPEDRQVLVKSGLFNEIWTQSTDRHNWPESDRFFEQSLSRGLGHTFDSEA